MTAKKNPAKTAGKPTVKATRGNIANLKPLSRDDPRRNKTIPGPGRPPDAFKAMMRELASSEATLRRLVGILNDPDEDDVYLKALAFAADRGFGKAQQHVDVTSGGDSIADILRKGRERVALMRGEG